METLGEAIGRYVTINANITNTMNRKSYFKRNKKAKCRERLCFQ